MTHAAVGPEAADRRCFRLRKWKLLIVVFLFLILGTCFVVWRVGTPVPERTDYDKHRFKQIRKAIDSDWNHLIHRRFDEVSKELELEGIPWDDISLSLPQFCRERMYHFRGFYLQIVVERLPLGIEPGSGKSWSSTELNSGSVLWVSLFKPSLHIDGISDPKERMEKFRKAQQEEFDRINAEIQQRNSGQR